MGRQTGKRTGGWAITLLVILAAAVFSLVISVWGVYGNGGGIAGGGLLAAALISLRFFLGGDELDRYLGELPRLTLESLAPIVILMIGFLTLGAERFPGAFRGGLGSGFKEL